VPAVKAALHRGRSLLRQGPASTPDAAPARSATPELQRYAHLFNARDWDGVRALLADDVRLDLVSRRKAAGRREVGVYFTNYERLDDWWLVPAWLDGRAVLAVLPGRGEGRPGNFIELQWRDGRLSLIRDFRHVPYIARDADLVLAP
jgi:RNA polymerase sigma-70 factor (ECF subfamily)